MAAAGVPLVIDAVGRGKQDAKALIVGILSGESPLTARELHSRIKSHSLTYQAVHKALQELLSARVVSVHRTDGVQYSLSFDWIDRLSRYSEELKSTYTKSFEGVPAGQTTLFFNSVYEIDAFLISFLKKIFDPQERVLALQWSHFWIPLFFPRTVYEEMRAAIELTDAYSVSASATPLDKWCANYWSKTNLKHKLGAKEASGVDTVAYGDIVIHVLYPLEIKRKMNEVYSQVKDVSKFDVDKFFTAVFEKKTQIPVVITRNRALADQIKKETIALCKGR